MNKKLSIKVQKIASTLPLNAKAFSNAVVINPEDLGMQLKKGSLYAVFDIKGNSDFDVLLTTKVINDVLHNTYFLSETYSPIQALEKAVLEVKEKVVSISSQSGENTEFNIIVAVLWGNVVYIVQYGNAKSYLVRDGAINPINASTEGYFSVSSGVVKDSDVIILGNQEFTNTISPEKLLSDPAVLQNLPITSSSLILKFIVDAVFTSDDMVSFNEHLPMRNISRAGIRSFISGLKYTFSSGNKLREIKLKSPRSSKIPKTATLFVVAIASLFALSVFFTVRRNSGKLSLDKSNVLSSEIAKQTELDRKALDEKNKIIRVVSTVFYDTKIVDRDSNPGDLLVADEYLAVSDKEAGALYTSLLTTPKLVKDLKTYKNITSLSYIGGKLGFSDADGYIIYDLSKGEAVKNYTFSRELSGITTAYLDFIYEVKDGKITKFVKSGDKLEDSLWVQSNDFNNVSDLAINVSVFVGKEDGALLSYTRGVKDVFEITGLDKPLAKITKIIADSNNDHLYIADSENQRIVVIDNKGNLIKQIKNSEDGVWNDIRAIGINNDASKLYVLSGSKIYEASL